MNVVRGNIGMILNQLLLSSEHESSGTHLCQFSGDHTSMCRVLGLKQILHVVTCLLATQGYPFDVLAYQSIVQNRQHVSEHVTG